MNILIMASSKGIGLTYHISRLLLEFKRQGIDIVALTSNREQERGIIGELEAEGVKLYKDACIENLDPLNFWKSVRLVKRVLITEEIDIVHVQGVSHIIKVLPVLKIFKRKNPNIKITYRI